MQCILDFLVPIFIPFKDVFSQGIIAYLSILTLTMITLYFVSKHYSNTEVLIPLDGKIDNVEKSFLKSALVTYFLWGLVQQIFVVTIFKLCSLFLPFTWALIASCLFFSFFVHYPNILLIFATLGLQFVNLLLFREYNNIYLMGFLHGILATTLKYYYPESITKNFTIWFDFFRAYPKIKK